MIRRAETDVDLERCVEIFNAVHPDHGLVLQDIRNSQGRCLLHPGGGYAYLSSSSIPGWQYTMVRVESGARRRGVGSALLEAAAHAARIEGLQGLVGRVVDPRRRRVARMGGRVRLPGDPAGRGAPAWAATGDGEVAEGIVPMRAEHLRGAYAVEVECVPDVPATTSMAAVPFERWHELISAHAVTFVAVDDGCVVGYATLEHLHGMPHRLEHGLTAVLRSHRGRGIATKLKSAQIAWAADNGYTELITATDTTNLAMRRVNTKLGYVERLGAIVVEREL
jgi:mycothiol synthase